MLPSEVKVFLHNSPVRRQICAQIFKTTIWSRHFQAPTIFLNCYCLYIPCSAIDTLAKERGHAATTTKFYTSCITHVFSCLAIPGIGISYKRFGQVSAFLRLKMRGQNRSCAHHSARVKRKLSGTNEKDYWIF